MNSGTFFPSRHIPDEAEKLPPSVRAQFFKGQNSQGFRSVPVPADNDGEGFFPSRHVVRRAQNQFIPFQAGVHAHWGGAAGARRTRKVRSATPQAQASHR